MTVLSFFSSFSPLSYNIKISHFKNIQKKKKRKKEIRENKEEGSSGTIGQPILDYASRKWIVCFPVDIFKTKRNIKYMDIRIDTDITRDTIRHDILHFMKN